jgi:hypothetical protein
LGDGVVTNADFHYPRSEFAESLVAEVLGRGLADHSSGLFLAAPRRTGKSTFLRRDLVPALERAGLATLYADLWSDQSRDPAELIAEVIRQALIDHKPVARAARRAGLTKIGLGTSIAFDLDKVGKPDGATLTDALSALHRAVKRPIALILDEAQHALTSKSGTLAMFALKAARDSLNQSALGRSGAGERKLLLIFTGSHRDKLSNLVLKRNQPFYGAAITPFPLLDRGFTDALTSWVNKRVAKSNQLKAETAFEAFRILGHKPEHLRQVIAEVALSGGGLATLDDMVRTRAGALRARLLDGIRQDLDTLTATQRAVLTVMVERGDAFVPFAAESLAEYSRRAQKEVDASDAQGALDALRKKGLVWKSERSIYLLEDPAIAEVVKLRNTSDGA